MTEDQSLKERDGQTYRDRGERRETETQRFTEGVKPSVGNNSVVSTGSIL